MFRYICSTDNARCYHGNEGFLRYVLLTMQDFTLVSQQN